MPSILGRRPNIQDDGIIRAHYLAEKNGPLLDVEGASTT